MIFHHFLPHFLQVHLLTRSKPPSRNHVFWLWLTPVLTINLSRRHLMLTSLLLPLPMLILQPSLLTLLSHATTRETSPSDSCGMFKFRIFFRQKIPPNATLRQIDPNDLPSSAKIDNGEKIKFTFFVGSIRLLIKLNLMCRKLRNKKKLR